MIVTVEFSHVCTPNLWSVFSLSPMPGLGKANVKPGHGSFFFTGRQTCQETDRPWPRVARAERLPRTPKLAPRAPFPKVLAASAPRKPQTLIGPPGATGLLQLAGHGAPWECFSHGLEDASPWGLRFLSLGPVTAKGWPSWRLRPSPRTEFAPARLQPCVFLGSIMA